MLGISKSRKVIQTRAKPAMNNGISIRKEIILYRLHTGFLQGYIGIRITIYNRHFIKFNIHYNKPGK